MLGDDDKTKDTSPEPTLAELAKIMRETCSAVKDLSARAQALEVAAEATTVAMSAVSLPASLAPTAWPPSPTVWTEGANSTRGSVSTRVSTRAPATGVAPTPTTGAVVLQHPFVDGIFYKGIGVQQVQVSAVVRLQAAVRGLLARRRLREMHQIEQPAVAVMETTRTCPRAAVVRLPAAVRGLLARRRLREVRHHPKPIGGLQIFSGHNNAREAHSQLLPRDPDCPMLAGVLRVYMQLIPGLFPWDPVRNRMPVSLRGGDGELGNLKH
jgi:hypothetical protein